jgi:hypothetical protein
MLNESLGQYSMQKQFWYVCGTDIDRIIHAAYRIEMILCMVFSRIQQLLTLQMILLWLWKGCLMTK